MAEIEIRYEGLKGGLLAKLVSNPASIQGEIRRALTRAANQSRSMGVGLIQENTPVLTGKLISSVSSAIERIDSEGLTISWFSDVIYAPPVEARRHMFDKGIRGNEAAIVQPFQDMVEDLANELEG